MRLFWEIAGFEFRKIWKRKSAMVAFFVLLGLNACSFLWIFLGSYYEDGERVRSNYSMVIEQRESAKSIQGCTVDDELFRRVGRLIEQQWEKKDEGYWHANHLFTELSSLTVQRLKIGAASAMSTTFYTDWGRNEDVGYYDSRNLAQKAWINEMMTVSDKTKQKLFSMEEEVKKPFVYSYTQGYQRMIEVSLGIGVFACLSTAVCVAPLFAGEYTSGMDQLILSSRHGKRRAILAKIVVGSGIGILNILLQILCAATLSFIIYGTEGFHAPYQMFDALSPYPLTMGQALLLVFVCSLAGTIFFTAIVMMLSARLKTPFTVIILALILALVPAILSVTKLPYALIFNLLPGRMCAEEVVLSPILYQFGDLILLPWQVILITAAAGAVLLMPLAYRVFKNHQIS